MHTAAWTSKEGTQLSFRSQIITPPPSTSLPELHFPKQQPRVLPGSSQEKGVCVIRELQSQSPSPETQVSNGSLAGLGGGQAATVCVRDVAP